MKKSLNAPKKEAQLWLNLSQTASPNGKNTPKSHSTFHSRHIMIHPEACNFIAITAACNFSAAFFHSLRSSVSLFPFFHFCQEYFWSIITSCSSNLNFTSLAIFGKTVLPTIPIFTFCSDHCETSINA